MCNPNWFTWWCSFTVICWFILWFIIQDVMFVKQNQAKTLREVFTQQKLLEVYILILLLFLHISNWNSTAGHTWSYGSQFTDTQWPIYCSASVSLNNQPIAVQTRGSLNNQPISAQTRRSHSFLGHALPKHL